MAHPSPDPAEDPASAQSAAPDLAPDVSMNALAGELADAMASDAARLRIGVSRGAAGEALIDCGVAHLGGFEAGLRMAEVCMGGLGSVRLVPSEGASRWPWRVLVRSSQPVTACLGSQSAGWALKHEEEGTVVSALGSGPARALARHEPLFKELPHQEAADRAVLVVESDAPLPEALALHVAEACGVDPARLTVLFAPTTSLAGSLQVAARVVEVALLKAHKLEFPLGHIAEAIGSAPLSPPHPDRAVAMGRTNDAIIFGGRVQLFVTGEASAARQLAEALPSFRSHDYGAPFAEIFRRAGEDFYAIDPLLFSPAWVAVSALDTGETFRAGTLSEDLLDASFS